MRVERKERAFCGGEKRLAGEESLMRGNEKRCHIVIQQGEPRVRPLF